MLKSVLIVSFGMNAEPETARLSYIFCDICPRIIPRADQFQISAVKISEHSAYTCTNILEVTCLAEKEDLYSMRHLG